MIRLVLAAGVAVGGLAATAAAQPMPSMDMSDMKMPGMTALAPPAAKPKLKLKPLAKPNARAPAWRRAFSAPHAYPKRAEVKTAVEKDMSGMPGMPGIDHGAMSGISAGAMPSIENLSASPTALPTGAAPAPVPPTPTDHYADRFFPKAAMERSRLEMMREDGGQTIYKLLLNLAEDQVGDGGYRWNGEGYIGGDINKLWTKSEGEGSARRGVDSAEVQALYSRAVDSYFDLQAGVRQDIRPSSSATYATVGFEGLAPYAVETEGALFLSSRGEVLGRIEGWYDQRLTQRVILQPRVELNISAQDMPKERYGAGLVDAELGLRLRYEKGASSRPTS